MNNEDVLICEPQDASDSYFTFPTEKECYDFEQGGLKLVDEQEYMEFIQLNYL